MDIPTRETLRSLRKKFRRITSKTLLVLMLKALIALKQPIHPFMGDHEEIASATAGTNTIEYKLRSGEEWEVISITGFNEGTTFKRYFPIGFQWKVDGAEWTTFHDDLCSLVKVVSWQGRLLLRGPGGVRVLFRQCNAGDRLVSDLLYR